MYRLLLLSAALIAAPVAAAHTAKRFVEFEVTDPTGRSFTTYPAASEAGDVLRRYLLAEPGARYRLRLYNPNAERVGVVIAVDGRNIISGRRSELGAGEAMYVIDGHRTQVFSGWRTDADHVQAFYFTDAGDSYAGAWGDYSAMGTIAVAVFREQHARARPPELGVPGQGAPRAKAPGADAGSAARESSAAEDRAGTGFGERQWSHSRRVHFDADRTPAFRHIVKYEWRSALCRRGLAACDPGNRMWPDTGFAPRPPGYVAPRW